jgi:hypothetical protein
MSTTARSSKPIRSGRAADRPLTARAVRVRNACLRHAAVRLGLRIPDDAELTALRPDASLTEAVQWLGSAQPTPDISIVGPSRPRLLLRAGFAATVMLLALVLSYGTLH